MKRPPYKVVAILMVGGFWVCSANCGGNNNSGAGSSNDPSGSPKAQSTNGGLTLVDGSVLAVSVSDGGAIDPDAFWAQDPPAAVCDGGGMLPHAPGGTPECPDDKNRKGCPCTPGAQAACWPGLRKNRNRGICHDGHTSCQRHGEIGGVWGECEGYVVPKAQAISSDERCGCFTHGLWKVKNLTPCFWRASSSPTSEIVGALSAECKSATSYTLPNYPWSEDTLTVDCAGHFKLCFTLKAGNSQHPQPTDCTLTSPLCVEGDYVKEGIEQAFPSLPAWIAQTPDQKTCAKKFHDQGGYAEMTVSGLSVECDPIPEHVFNRIGYCPETCNSNPHGPECVSCMQGASGQF